MKPTTVIRPAFVCLAAFAFGLFATDAPAVTYTVRVDGSDAIFLAGRTDLTIPPPGQSWPGGLLRHSSIPPEGILETLPPTIPVNGGDVVRVLDPAIGGINFYNGFGPPYYGPDGAGTGTTNLTAFGGISGFYADSLGPLVGVFLDDTIPDSAPPTALNFTASGLGTDFLTLSPGLRQVFFIGDGVTSGGDFQQFIAPAGATRLALGIADGFSFVGNPGAYDDNDGFYEIRVGINQIPDPVPEPGAWALAASTLIALAGLARRSVKTAGTTRS